MTGQSTSDSICPRCGGSLLPTALGGHCPQCLVRTSLGLASLENEPSADAPLLFLRSFGDYELIEEIARGGMGVVYRARQRSLKRVVALKMLLAGEFASPEFVQRFRTEAETVASLQHPHIVSVYEVGQQDGQHFFSMELIEGRNLAALTQDGPLPSRMAANYLRLIAEAVSFAHQHGILHRDLKPSNILVDPFDQPRITDFGLARHLLSQADLTRTGQAFGSPSYMAPELANGATAAGVSTDIYSLGAVLYQLLTGRPPFQSDMLLETLRQAQQEEPVSPQRLNRSIPIDLQTICLKCLEKDPARRYDSAHDLALDLQRFLDNEPIRARPVSRMRKLSLWSKRHPGIATSAAATALLLLALAIGTSAAAWRISVARRAEQSANTELRASNSRLAHTVSLLELQRAEDFFRVNDSAAGLAHLAAIVRRDPSNEVATARLVSALVHRNWALPAVTIYHPGKVTSASFSPDGRNVLSASFDHTAQVHDSITGQLLGTARHEGPVLRALYDTSGERFVTASTDGTARIWNATNAAPLSAPLRHKATVTWAEFRRDGQMIATASDDQTVKLWTSGGKLLNEFSSGGSEMLFARFSPKGDRLATAEAKGIIRVWNIPSGKLIFNIPAHQARIEFLTYSPDGRLLASASDDHTVKLWRADNGRPLCAPLEHGDVVYHVAFNPDGGSLLTSSFSGLARLWSANNGFPIGAPLEHDAGVTFGSFSRDGQLAVTTGLDHTARVWSMANGLPFCQPFRQLERMVHADFDPAAKRIVAASVDGYVQVWNIEPRKVRPLQLRLASNVTAFAFAPKGDLLLASSIDGTAQLWNSHNGQPIGGPLPHSAAVLFCDFNPDGSRFTTTTEDGKAFVHETKSRRLVAGPFQHSKAIRHAHFSADGKALATASDDGTARIWDIATGRPVSPPLVHSNSATFVRFSRNNRWLATASNDQTARVWDAQAGTPVAVLGGHLDSVTAVDFSFDSELLVTASGDNTARVWKIPSGVPVATLRHGRTVPKATFAPGDHRVATVSLDLTARVWDGDTGEAISEPMKHNIPATQVSFSSNGGRILSGGWNGLVRVWDARTGRALSEWLPNAGAIITGCFDPSGERVAAAADNIISVWNVPPLPSSAPVWLPEFAESVAGTRLTERGNLELISRQELPRFSQRFKGHSEGNAYERIVEWFLAEPSNRLASPFN